MTCQPLCSCWPKYFFHFYCRLFSHIYRCNYYSLFWRPRCVCYDTDVHMQDGNLLLRHCSQYHHALYTVTGILIFCLLSFSSLQTHLWCLPESCSPRVGFLILIFIDVSGSLPQKGHFEAAKEPWICKVSIMVLTRTNAYIIDSRHSIQK